MNRLVTFAVVLSASAAVAYGAESRDFSKEVEVDPKQTVRIELPVGEIRVNATKGSSLTADLTVKCRWARPDCFRALKEVELKVRSSLRRLRLELEGLPRWHTSKLEIEGTLTVPRSAPLEIDLGMGSLEISGPESDLWVDMGVGKVAAWLPRETVGLVSLNVGVGKAELFGAGPRVESRRSFLVGGEAYWDDGPGRARIHIDLGVGEIAVRLE